MFQKPSDVRASDGKLFFTAISGTLGRELWVTDGTTAGTSLVKDIAAGSGSGTNSYFGGLSLGGGKVLFGGADGEPWITDGSAGGTYQLKDIRPGAAKSLAPYGPPGFVSIGGSKALFVANDGSHGNEVWITDGTSAGTSLVADIFPGASTSTPTGFTTVPGGKVVFTATAPGTVGRELWITDGTSAGTSLLVDLFPGTFVRFGYTYVNSGSPTLVGNLADGRALFSAANGVVGRELWVTDGTAAGTSLVKDINPYSTSNTSGPANPASSNPANFVSLGNGQFAFTANDGKTGVELWVTDGTAAGTHATRDINTINAGSNTTAPTQGRAFQSLGNGKFTFVANDGLHGNEMWVSDGTAAGTSLLKDINPGGNNGGPAQVMQVVLGDGRELFDANDGTTRRLWITDGTGAGTSLLSNVQFPSGGFLLAPDKALFTGYGTDGSELWITDGSAAGTSQIKDINPGPYGMNMTDITHFGTGALFGVSAIALGKELWFTDGTAAGTSLVAHIHDGGYGFSDAIANMTPLGSKVVFTADDGITGTELWITDGTAAGTSLLKDIRTGTSYGYPASSNPSDFAKLDSTHILFRASDGVAGKELWITDGTAAGTSMVKDIYPGAYSSGYNGAIIAMGNGKALFTASDPVGGGELWITDGTAAGTSLAVDIIPGAVGAFPSYLTAVGNGRVVFSASTPTDGTELWATDGTPGGTVMLRDFNPGTGSSYPRYFRATGDGHVLFEGSSAQNGREVWITDGTVDGTRMIADVNTVSSASNPSAITVFHTNDPPVAQAGSASGDEDHQIAGTAIATDTDGIPAPITISKVTGTQHGQLVLNPDGSFIYTPDPDFAGPDSFTFKANDGAADSNTATFQLTVNPVNDTPVFTSAANFSIPENQTAIGTVAANDVEHDPLSFSLAGGPDQGFFTIDATTGALRFINTPDFETQEDANHDNIYDLTVRVTDLPGAATTQAVHVTVTNLSEPGTTLNGGNGNDTLNGTTGNDTISGGNGDDTVNGGDGNDNLTGGNGNDRLTGGRGNDSLDGGNGDDRLDAGSGNNQLNGGNGNDIMLAGDGNNSFDAGNGDDTMTAGSGNNSLDAGNGNDILTVGNGNNTLLGGNGDDRFVVGTGNNTMTGGNGNDVFVFAASLGQNTVTDFNRGDRFDFSHVTSLGSFAAVQGAAHQVGADTVISPVAGQSITLQHVLASSLRASDFQF